VEKGGQTDRIKVLDRIERESRNPYDERRSVKKREAPGVIPLAWERHLLRA